MTSVDVRLTKFQLSLLREAMLKGTFSSYMVPNKSIKTLAGAGFIKANARASWFKTTQHFEITEAGRDYVRRIQEGE